MADDIVTRLRDAEDNGICEWQVLIDAADEIERLQVAARRALNALNEANQILDQMTSILHRTANALHGGPLPNGLHSWHDLPELAERLREEARRG